MADQINLTVDFTNQALIQDRGFDDSLRTAPTCSRRRAKNALHYNIINLISAKIAIVCPGTGCGQGRERIYPDTLCNQVDHKWSVAMVVVQHGIAQANHYAALSALSCPPLLVDLHRLERRSL
jgi:hypothetical protein